MSKQTLTKIIKELASNGIASVVLTGGEPLLHPELLLEAARLCREYGVPYSINTNLTIRNDKLFSELLKFGSVSVLTSIASYDEAEHDAMMGRAGAYVSTIETAKKLIAMGINVSANMVFTKVNVASVFETGKFAHSLGMRSFFAAKACCPSGFNNFEKALAISKDEFRQSLDDLLRVRDSTGMQVGTLVCYPHCALGDIGKYEALATRHCSAGKTGCAISATGDLRPCIHSDLVYGNLLREPLSRVYARMDDWRDGSLLPEKCLECPQFGPCGGGCRYGAKSQGELTDMDVFATGPDDVSPAKVEAERLYFSETDMVKVHSVLKKRRESFGYIFYNSSGKTLMLDDEAGVIVEKLTGTQYEVSHIYSIAQEHDRKEVDHLLAQLINSNLACLV